MRPSPRRHHALRLLVVPIRDFPTDASRHSSLNSVSNLSAARWALVPGTGRLASCMANYSSGNVAACAIRVAIGGQVPHFAVRFRWHAPGVVNKSLGAVVPTRTPFTWPASTYSRTSSARPWIDLTTTERLNYRYLCPDVLRKGWGQSPTIVRWIGAPAFRDAGHREQAHQGGTQVVRTVTRNAQIMSRSILPPKNSAGPSS